VANKSAYYPASLANGPLQSPQSLDIKSQEFVLIVIKQA
jgi:hypothetical protein